MMRIRSLVVLLALLLDVGAEGPVASKVIPNTPSTSPPSPPPPPTKPWDGLERGIIYVQPSYHYTNTLSLNVTRLREDIGMIKYYAKNITNIGLRVAWGELMTVWDPETNNATWNEENCDALTAIEKECNDQGMRLIFNTHLKDSVPRGIDGAYYVERGPPDENNVTGGFGDGVWRSKYEDIMVRDSYREPLILFHKKLAECLKPYPSVPRFFKHAFESTYLFPQQVSQKALDAGCCTAATTKFAQWAQNSNPSIQHWGERWGEPKLSSFNDIQIPGQLNTTKVYKAKFGDFWRFWLLDVLKSGRYGLSINEILGGLRDGAEEYFEPEVAFKHWSAANFNFYTDLNQTELKLAYDLPINATALGYYVNDKYTLAAEPAKFEAYIDAIKAVAPPQLPIIQWETGASTNNLSEQAQVQWAQIMMRTLTNKGVQGFNWWQFIDWAPIPTKPCASNTQCDLLHFGALYSNGTKKWVWSIL